MDAIRNRFEESFRRKHPGISLDFSHGKYANSNIQAMWEMWKDGWVEALSVALPFNAITLRPDTVSVSHTFITPSQAQAWSFRLEKLFHELETSTES